MDTDDANEMTRQVETKIGTILTDGNSDGVRIEQVGEKHYFFELPFACAASRPNSFRVRREVKRSVAGENHFLGTVAGCDDCRRGMHSEWSIEWPMPTLDMLEPYLEG